MFSAYVWAKNNSPLVQGYWSVKTEGGILIELAALCWYSMNWKPFGDGMPQWALLVRMKKTMCATVAKMCAVTWVEFLSPIFFSTSVGECVGVCFAFKLHKASFRGHTTVFIYLSPQHAFAQSWLVNRRPAFHDCILRHSLF